MNWNRIFRDLRGHAEAHRQKLPYIGVAALVLVLFCFSKAQENTKVIYRSEGKPDFQNARILGTQTDPIFSGKEKVLSKSVRELEASQNSLRETNAQLLARIEGLEMSARTAPEPAPSPTQGANLSPSQAVDGSPMTDQTHIRLGAAPGNLSVGEVALNSAVTQGRFGSRRENRRPTGPSIISFPVKETGSERVEVVTLPAGSYVKAKLMTGVEAPEGKTYPTLLQLDYAYIIPNKKKLDLSGCFMIAKSQGDLSTERVQMQATKLSCVSKEGRMFEREVNGFIADDKDNSFAVIGSVNSKQDRVATMAFLSSIVEGVGKSIQQAQTTNQTNALGGSQSVITGDQATYMAAGGAANAASMVTQWYLRQAQNLLPTINVGSGQDVWIVMQDSVKLPNDYFRKPMKGGARESGYTYFSRILD